MPPLVGTRNQSISLRIVYGVSLPGRLELGGAVIPRLIDRDQVLKFKARKSLAARQPAVLDS